MTVWLSSPGGGGTIPGFCWRGRKGSDLLAIFTTVWKHKMTLESHNWDSLACRHLLGRVTCRIGCPSQKAQPHPEQTELTFFPSRPRKKKSNPGCCACQGSRHSAWTMQSTPAVDCAFHARCGLCSLYPLWDVTSTLHRTTEYSSRHSPRPAEQT